MLKLNPAAPSSTEEIQKTQDLRFYGNNFLYVIDIFYIFGIFGRRSLDLGRESWGWARRAVERGVGAFEGRGVGRRSGARGRRDGSDGFFAKENWELKGLGRVLGDRRSGG